MRGDEAHVHHRPGHAEFHQNEQNKDGKPGGKEPAREVVAPHAACPYGQQHKARPHHGNARQIESGRHGNLPHPDGTEHGDPCQNAQGKQHDEKPAPAQRRGDAAAHQRPEGDAHIGGGRQQPHEPSLHAARRNADEQRDRGGRHHGRPRALNEALAPHKFDIWGKGQTQTHDQKDGEPVKKDPALPPDGDKLRRDDIENDQRQDVDRADQAEIARACVEIVAYGRQTGPHAGNHECHHEIAH